MFTQLLHQERFWRLSIGLKVKKAPLLISVNIVLLLLLIPPRGIERHGEPILFLIRKEAPLRLKDPIILRVAFSVALLLEEAVVVACH